MRKKLAAGVLIVVVVMGVVFLGPFNIISEFNERGALKDFISSDNTFKGLEILDIDYRGSDTFFVQTQDGNNEKNFIIMRYNSSVMNGHWKVFEETSKEKYY
ncbi:hypothetical protein JOC78_003001 [Bacillus ectoiniformans]|uniref:hypothetical protein n=1 Tax=Bacillus ectoiniformans TaxID=1494429 RepID=UPI00195B26BB|nr:hypothetical protein [Bacillus ectoiniformans]MBM7650017.1 hypothetical protein [Bacillus ectoiniformans]